MTGLLVTLLCFAGCSTVTRELVLAPGERVLFQSAADIGNDASSLGEVGWKTGPMADPVLYLTTTGIHHRWGNWRFDRTYFEWDDVTVGGIYTKAFFWTARHVDDNTLVLHYHAVYTGVLSQRFVAFRMPSRQLAESAKAIIDAQRAAAQ